MADNALTLYELSQATGTMPRADSQTSFLKALNLVKPKRDALATPPDTEALARLANLPASQRFHAAFQLSKQKR